MQVPPEFSPKVQVDIKACQYIFQGRNCLQKGKLILTAMFHLYYGIGLPYGVPWFVLIRGMNEGFFFSSEGT